MGYGFVHFARIHDAYTFMERLEGYRFDHTSSTKALTACVAKRQSVYASLRACMKTPHRLLDGKARGRLMCHHDGKSEGMATALYCGEVVLKAFIERNLTR